MTKTLGQTSWERSMAEANQRARDTGKRQRVKHAYRVQVNDNRMYAYFVVNEAFLPGGRYYDRQRFRR
jgi:hypothetical protein